MSQDSERSQRPRWGRRRNQEHPRSQPHPRRTHPQGSSPNRHRSSMRPQGSSPSRHRLSTYPRVPPRRHRAQDPWKPNRNPRTTGPPRPRARLARRGVLSEALFVLCPWLLLDTVQRGNGHPQRCALGAPHGNRVPMDTTWRWIVSLGSSRQGRQHFCTALCNECAIVVMPASQGLHTRAEGLRLPTRRRPPLPPHWAILDQFRTRRPRGAGDPVVEEKFPTIFAKTPGICTVPYAGSMHRRSMGAARKSRGKRMLRCKIVGNFSSTSRSPGSRSEGWSDWSRTRAIADKWVPKPRILHPGLGEVASP
jgi:hypothetical protein